MILRSYRLNLEIVNSKPTIILFPGAFHPASCLEPLLGHIRAQGFEAEAHTLLSVGNPQIGVNDDEEYMRSIMNAHIAKGKDVVLIVHSYAGFPAPAAISGLDKRRREAKGEAGGVLGVIYLASFVPFEGDTLFEGLGSAWKDWMIADENTGLIDTKDRTNVFYADCHADIASKVGSTLQGQSIKSFRGLDAKARLNAWKDDGYNGRRAYVRCLQDIAIPIAVQDHFVERSGVDWIVKTLDASHSPFLSMPDVVAADVGDIVGRFAAAK